MWIDILLVVLIAAALFLAARKIVRDKRRGKCTCDCADCPGCGRGPQ